MVQSPVTKIDPSIASRLSKQRYQLVGEHGGVKVCHWTKQSLIADRSCYKGTFYGIESHGCRNEFLRVIRFQIGGLI